jgi:hypothetical protein
MLPFASQHSAATLVADRLKFLEALRFILFDYDARHKLRERSQLHKILEQNTWIFGEEYNLCASDKDLTTVLKAHREKLDPDLVIDDPVKVINKTRGIVDLMLSRAQRRHSSNARFHPRSGMASTSIPPIMPRERLGAERRDLLRVGNILIGQAGADARPCLLEPRLRVDEICGVAPVVTALRSAVEVAGPCPLWPVVRCPVAEHDPAD